MEGFREADLTGKMREVAEVIGLADTVRMVSAFSGETFRFCKIGLGKSGRNRDIVQAHQRGASYADLSKRYRLTVDHIRRIVRAGDTHNFRPVLSERLQALAECIGSANTLILIGRFDQLRIQSIETLKRNQTKRLIAESFNGSNTLELSKQYRVDQRYIRDIIRESGPILGAERLF